VCVSVRGCVEREVVVSVVSGWLYAVYVVVWNGSIPVEAVRPSVRACVRSCVCTYSSRQTEQNEWNSGERDLKVKRSEREKGKEARHTTTLLLCVDCRPSTTRGFPERDDRLCPSPAPLRWRRRRRLPVCRGPGMGSDRDPFFSPSLIPLL